MATSRFTVPALALWAAISAAQAAPRLLAVRPVMEPATASTPARIARTAEGVLRMAELPPGHPDRVRLERLAAEAPVARMAELVGLARSLAKKVRPDEPIPVALTEELGPVGPRSVAFSALRIETPDGGAARATQGYILMAPFELERGGAGLDQMERVGMMPAILIHELFHMAMSTVYAIEYLELQAQANPFARHDSPVETDPPTALIEGLAECAELLMEKRFPGRVYQAADPTLPEPVRAYAADCRTRRFVRADRNRYVFEADGRVRDGALEPARDMLVTEGVVAGVVADMLAALGRPGDDGLDLLLGTLATRRPRSAGALFRALAGAAGDRAAALDRTVLESTWYALADREARPRYQAAYLAKKAFVQGAADRPAWLAARAAYDAWKGEVRARIAAGRSAYAAVPEPFLVQTEGGLKADLNEPDPEVLADRLGGLAVELGTDPRLLAGKIVAAREAGAGLFDPAVALPAGLDATLGPARTRAVEAERTRLRKAALKLLEAARSQEFGGPAPCFAGPLRRPPPPPSPEELP